MTASRNTQTPAVRFSQRAGRTHEPPISWLMKYALDHPDCISLAAGFVDAATLPVQIVKECVDELMASPASGRAALQYGTTIGYPPLRRQIAQRLADSDGMTAASHGFDADHVMVTTGSQQLLFLASDVLLDPGDIVVLGAPSYFVYMGILQSMGAVVRSVPVDGDGMDMEALADTLAAIEAEGKLDRLKLIYVVSYYQNPMGVSMSADRRPHVVELAKKYSAKAGRRIFVLEDAAYKELRFSDDSPALPPIKKFDPTNEWVLFAGTFCKPFSAGMKTGFGILPDAILDPVLRQKGNHDFGSANLNQMVISRAIERGSYDQHVRKVRAGYAAKKQVMADGIRRYFPPQTKWHDPAGGLYIWAELPESVCTSPGSPYFKAALERGVLYVPSEHFYYPDSGSPACRSGMRLSFGVASPEQVADGIKRLGQLACEMLKTPAAAK
ncbi:MAG: 2-aminoadipate transaminase [Phycisphaerae bacterium]|nr:2-aminoadipate transaminase [Phycisphaerae bacterium]